MKTRKSSTIRKIAVNKAIDYIMMNLEEDITVNDVANYCGYSRYYLTRVFKEEVGEAIYQYILRIRMEKSAVVIMVENERSIGEIGGEYGYSSSNFATVFKKKWGISPESYRITSDYLKIFPNKLKNIEERVTIEYLELFKVVYERKKGNYRNIPEDWRNFVKKYKNFVTKETKYIEGIFDDPFITDEDNCMYELCQTIENDRYRLEEKSSVMTQFLGGGEYAIYHFVGNPKFIFMAYQEFLANWVPNSGRRLERKKVLNIYRKIEKGYIEMDICFPLKKKNVFE